MNAIAMPESAATGAFHAGELQAQALAGFTTSGAGIRDYMPEQHRTFFATLNFLLLATTGDDGWPLATVVAGEPGFIASPDERTLSIRAVPDPQDPVLSQLGEGSAVGMLGIDFRTRRRNRANGIVNAVNVDGLQIGVRQSFGNCPKYIHARDVAMTPVKAQAATDVHVFTGLNTAARELISAATTFFVATASGRQASPGGVDISHRGGVAGFVKIDGDTLICPDYLGNRYFNTLGNLMVEPRAALLFVDFSNGDVWHLRGKAEILWQTEEIQQFPGAERLWRFKVERGSRRGTGQLIAR
ncbi:MAG TPA: pyridoxamine 5'-phosphate oxidase family protein [Burkholderiaceae bacterium]|jgi:predicted pyridoxine 5'-phosphate oxidase superfamily flavin-nucleotide-binding protein|nr:pyridoxamine 5'-phosphate oxidase family protein [Burkholderiaceae bacterium]